MSIIDWPVDRWLEAVGAAALSGRETVRASYGIAQLAISREIPGDFVECGVFAGSQSAAMARAIWDFERDAVHAGRWLPASRRVHLFDSFEGVPAAGEYDLEWKAAGHPVGAAKCSLEACKKNMSDWGIPDELLVYHPGWFSDSIPRALGSTKADSLFDRKIAVLRLDADLYDSTLTCLQSLYPLVSPGGWVIIDDYHLDGCRQAVRDYFYPGAPGPMYWQKI